MNLDDVTKKVREDDGCVAELVNELCEDAQTQKLNQGQRVYVNHGIWAGSFGIFEGEANNGYVNIRLENGGMFQLPHVFVTAAEELTA